jgi:hypothetical protein
MARQNRVSPDFGACLTSFAGDGFLTGQPQPPRYFLRTMKTSAELENARAF